MKKTVCFVLSFLFIFSFPFTANAKNDDNIKTSAEVYVLYCVENGQVVNSKNKNKKMKPASTTKIMTSLLALEESASNNKEVVFTEDMIAEGSSMYLKVGEKVKLSDLATGMMMSSGNDAANATALSIAKSTEKFAELMNERARQIGMTNTNFVTPSGLDDENHYSTAYDMALLMSYALENEDFAKLASQKSATVNFVEPSSKSVTYSNHNRLLKMYDYCIGGKTGYTMAAGRCLVSAARKDNLTFVCVTLNDKNDWNDHIALYNYGFEQYSAFYSDDSNFYADVPCVGGKSDSIVISGEKDALFVVESKDKSKIKQKIYADSFVYAPVKKNEAVGRIDYILNGKTIYSVNLIATDKVEIKKERKSIFTKIKELFIYG